MTITTIEHAWEGTSFAEILLENTLYDFISHILPKDENVHTWSSTTD